MGGVRYSVVVPAFNEVENLGPLVDELVGVLGGDDYEVVLVDDNSSDGTADLCDRLSRDNPRVVSVRRVGGDHGMGRALIEGSGKARGGYVVWVMGDRSDSLETLPGIIRKLDEGYDMVIASRYMAGGSRGNLSLDKALCGSAYTLLARLVFGVPVHDITNAFRGFRRRMLADVGLESADFAISPEFAIKAHLRGFRLGEVPTFYRDRGAGRTKFNMFRMAVRYLGLFRLRLGFRGGV